MGETGALAQDGTWDVLIVGAGMAGVSAAHELRRTGASCLIIDKSRGYGGRSSVRRGQNWSADLGAQCVQQASPAWNQLLADQADQIQHVRVLNGTTPGVGLVHRQGMSALVKALAVPDSPSSATYWSTRAVAIQLEPNHHRWKVVCENGTQYSARHIILTAPLPQILALISGSVDSAIAWSSDFDALSQCKLTQNIAVVFRSPSRDWALPEPLWTQCSDEIDGLFDQGAKGLTGGDNILVAHLAPQISLDLWSHSDDAVADCARSCMTRLLNVPTGSFLDEVGLPALTVHRWRYAQYPHPIPGTYGSWSTSSGAKGPARLVIAGDAWGPETMPGMARAFESGRQAARDLMSLL